MTEKQNEPKWLQLWNELTKEFKEQTKGAKKNENDVR